MTTAAVLIALCVLILIAYLLDISAKKTRIPSAILLLIMGWMVRNITLAFEVRIPNLGSLLPVLGTVGLILIVLEGALELDYQPEKKTLIRKSFIMSLIPMLMLAGLLGGLFYYFSPAPHSLRNSLLNAIPFCVISSAIAIPSISLFSRPDREFVIYESSFSDIIGVMLFNFMMANEIIGPMAFVRFTFEIILLIILSALASFGIAWLMRRLKHHVKFTPLLLCVVLLYSLAKIWHLPGLLFVLLFGLFIGNLKALGQFKWIQYLQPDQVEEDINKLRHLLAEGAFMIRAFFFILFGFVLDTKEILDGNTFVWAVIISAMIYTVRAGWLFLLKLPVSPLIFAAPRGLITILLFLSLPLELSLPFVTRSLIIQVILICALGLMLGNMLLRKQEEEAASS